MAALRESDKRSVLVAMVLALGMLTIDATIVRVALPAIQRELDLSDVAQQWVINAYLLTLGVFVVAGGRLGDLLGRRRIFLLGLALFTLCSVLSGLAPSGALLIAARAGQGIGAAIMMPGCTAIVTDAYAGPHLGRAMGIMAGTAAAGLSIGPLLGGVILEVVDWRWIFFVNVPIAVVATVLTLRAVPDTRRPDAPPIDYPGLAVLGAALTGLTLGVMQAQTWGWGSPATLGLIAAGIAGFGLFVAVETHVAVPLIDVRLLRSRAMAAGNFIGFSAQFVVTGLVVLLAIYLQNVLDYSPLATGALLLPLTLPVLVMAPIAGRLADRVAPRTLVGAGMTVLALGTFAVGAAVRADSYLPILPGLIAVGGGFAVVLTSMTTTIMAAARGADRGMVSGVYTTARDIGASLGVAVMGSLLSTLETARLADDRLDRVDDERVHALLAGADTALRDVPATQAAAAQRLANDAFDAGFATTIQITAAVTALGAIAAWAFLTRERPTAAPASPDHAAHLPRA